MLEKTYYHNTIMEWGESLLIILGSVLLAKLLYWIIKRFVKTATAKTSTTLDDLLVDMLEEPAVVLLY